ncbi:putative serpin-Z6A isoform X2 [Zootermopsis nevadensis]|uniref:Leukocyte elastase inhibitor n=1 Tax=Zootermopsis nevadensis TaxID=136037 RepID=A0A067RBB9_ZOONE|nr:putative serpin-Z6A isoform X2 [Zootermopsis nevadensis]KDR21045.1 Leukocyte elastase inhibitor [Zootermopsis nevadensis]
MITNHWKMPPFLTALFLSICLFTVPAWMNYVDNRNLDPSAIVFPSSFIASFSTPNRVQNVDPQMQYIHAVEAMFAVTVRLKALLEMGATTNLLVSPISTTTALAELLLGARGSTREYLLKILTAVDRSEYTREPTVSEFHLHMGGLIKFLQTSSDYDDSYRLHFASALFLRPDLSLLPNFRSAATDLYGMAVLPTDFSGDPLGSLNKMNHWAAIHTMGTINKVFSHPLPKTTAAVLTNAIYFKGDWETPFNPRYTITGKFHSSDTRTVDVEFMRGQFDLMYVDSGRLGCRMISIPYKHSKASMYVILPDVGDLYNIQGFAAGLSVDDTLELISSLRYASITLVMPKMKLTQTFSIGKALSIFQRQIESGSKEKVFGSGPYLNKMQGNECAKNDGCNCSRNASTQNGNYKKVPGEIEYKTFDMSGASCDDRFRVDDIIHHVFLEVSEMGTVGAAVSATIVDYIGEFKNFKMDRPFLFFIRHDVTGTPLFWGTIVDPTNGGE